MRKFFEKIIQLDKVYHFLACWFITCVAAMPFIGLFDSKPLAGLAGAGIGMLFGVGKEVYDKCRGGSVSKGDLLADLFGCLAGFLCALGM